MLNFKKLIQTHERFHHSHYVLPYLFLPSVSKRPKGLFICFGSWGGRYNWLRHYYFTLIKSHHLLYMRDAHGWENQGAWYLGENGSFKLEASYQDLLAAVIKQSKIPNERIWAFGSSMGGFAAIYFAYRFNLGRAVALGPLFRPDPSTDIYKSVAGKSKVDLLKHTLKALEKTVNTNTYICVNKNDDFCFNNGLSEFVASCTRNHNRLLLEMSHVTQIPKNVGEHNAMYMQRPDVLKLIQNSLERRFFTT